MPSPEAKARSWRARRRLIGLCVAVVAVLAVACEPVKPPPEEPPPPPPPGWIATSPAIFPAFTTDIPDYVARCNASAPVQVSVYPTLIPDNHVLASVNDVFNAVYVRGDIVGDTLYYGRGAGQDATASAVLSDLADAALDLKCGTKSRIPPFMPHELEGAVQPMDEAVSRYYFRLTVVDKPGTLARIAAILGQAKIGISSVFQPEGHQGESVPLILMIHDATNAAVVKALTQIGRLAVVKAPPLMIRVENFE